MNHVTLDELQAMQARGGYSPGRGELLFVSGRGPLDLRIQEVTKSPWSHVGIFYDDRLLIEAVPTGVRVGTLDAYLGADNLLAVGAVDGLASDAAIAFALEQLGDPYNFAEIVEILAQSLWDARRTPRCAPARTWICSELVAAALLQGGVTMLRGGQCVTPEDCWLVPRVKLIARIR